tara:strand:- start:1736 stop:2236 length:501 start_codon:yes stop_codon:yes gene_type:complete
MIFFKFLEERKKNFFKKKNFYYSIILIIIFFFDRFTKINIINNFNEKTYYINDFLNLELVWNIGIGFGFFSTNSSLYYNLITLLIGLVIFALFYVFLLSENFDKIIYSIILGGALGNFYDRLTYKAVPDFIDMHYNNFHWFVFNVADIFITIGIIALLIKGFFKEN